MSLHLRVLLCVTLFARVTRTQDGDGFNDENRPYKFGFNIEGYQHRYEEKNEKGIIMGEYGFITGDGVYHLTVYATDENGNFKIVRTKNVYIGLPGEKTTTPVPAVSSLRPERVQEVTQKASPVAVQGVAGCGGCVIPTTAAPQGEVAGGILPVRGSTQGDSRPQPISGASREPGYTASRSPQAGYAGGAPGTGPGRLPVPNQIVQGPSQTPLHTSQGPSQPPQGPSQGPYPTFQGNPQQGNPSGLGDRGRIGDPSQNVPPIPNNVAEPGLNQITNDLNDPKIKQLVAKVPKMTDKVMSMEDLQALFYMFNYTLTHHGHNEVGNRRGDKNGSYFFNGRDGLGRNVSYVANEFGYQPNITLYDLTPEDTPKEETEKDLTRLLGNEFKWFYGKG